MTELVFDRYATNPDNYIVDELHELTETTADIIVPIHGAFYTLDFQVRVDGDPTPLVLGTHYKYISLDPALTSLTGKEVLNGIRMLAPYTGVVVSIRIDYRAVGGKEGQSSYLIKKLREAVEEVADGTIDFNSLEGLPDTYPPDPHDHNMLTDLTELEPLRESMQGIWDALTKARPVTLSQQALVNERERLLYVIGYLEKSLNAAMQSMMEHVVAELRTGNTVSFDRYAIYHDATNPMTGDILQDLTEYRIGTEIVIYHNDSMPPTVPANWVTMGLGGYLINTLNQITAFIVDDNGQPRVEVYYVQEN